jgi:hypothetical protein
MSRIASRFRRIPAIESSSRALLISSRSVALIPWGNIWYSASREAGETELGLDTCQKHTD